MDVATLNALVVADNTGTVAVNENVVVGHNDVLDPKGKTIEITSDPAVTLNGAHWSILPGKLRAMNGILFDCVSASSGLMLNVWATGLLRGKELFRCIGDNSCYDLSVLGGEWTKPQDMTTPIVDVNVNGPYFNRNLWQGIRFQTNGRPVAPVVSMKCANVANWIYGNTFRDINFEIPNAGAIHLESVFGTIMQQIAIFDANLFGSITDDLIKVTKRGNGLRSRSTLIDGYFRLSGILDEGKMDINIPDSVHYTPTLSVRMVDGIDGANVTLNVPTWIDKSLIRGRFL
jgi:hypothetical protein